MKVAFCLYGLSGGFSERISGRKSYSHNFDLMKKSFESYKKNIIKYNKNIKFRIYIHTRGHKNVNKIISMYRPKKYIIDKPILELLEKDKNYSHYNKLSLSQTEISVISRFDSINKVLNLADGKYDLIFLCRFDMIFLKPLDFNKILLDRKKILLLNNYHYYYKNILVNATHIDFEKIIKGEIKEDIELRKNDKNKYLNDHILIFKPNNKDKIIKMEQEYFKLKINIHSLFAEYLNKNFEVILSDISALYDAPLARQYIYKMS